MTTRLLSVVLVAVFAPAAVLNGCRADTAQREADALGVERDALAADTASLGASLRGAVRSVERQNAAVADLEEIGEAQRARLVLAESEARVLRQLGEADVQRVLLEPVPDIGGACESAVSYLGVRAADLTTDW